MAGGGRVHIKHENGTDRVSLVADSDNMNYEFNTKEGKKIVEFNSYIGESGGKPFRLTKWVMHTSERDNAASIMAGPTSTSFGVTVGGTKYAASLSAETRAIISARCPEPMSGKDLMFSSKWMPNDKGDKYGNAWLVDPKE